MNLRPRARRAVEINWHPHKTLTRGLGKDLKLAVRLVSSQLLATALTRRQSVLWQDHQGAAHGVCR